jgi:L-rhamnose mutarotase
MKRMSHVVGIKPDAIEEYKRLHEEVWPQVLAALSGCHLSNYSIFLREPENLLFSYWEYTGEDFGADMQRMLADAKVQEWWDLCAPLQVPLESRAADEWWAGAEEIFHLD